MPEFKIIPPKDINWRRKFKKYSIVIFVIVAIGIAFLIYKEQYFKACIVFFLPIIFFRNLYIIYRKAEEGHKSRATYKLLIESDVIIRTAEESPTIKILKNEIQSLLKERDGGIRVNGTEGIWIPREIEDFEKAEQLLANMVAPSLLGNNGEIPFEEKQSVFSIISDFTSNFSISILSIVIIIASYLKLYTYYSLYDLDINSYLDASEAILSFIVLWKEIIVILIYIILIHQIFGWIKLKKPKNIDDIKGKVERYYTFGFLAIIFSAICFIYYDFIENFSLTSNPYFLLGTLFLLIFVLVMLLYVGSSFIYHREKIVDKKHTLLAIVISAILITVAENRISYRMIVNGYPKYSVKLLMNDDNKLIESNDTTIFIGSTNNYYFFRNSKNNSNIIISKSAVLKELSSKNRSGL